MQQLVEFAGNHWELFAALTIVLGLLAHNLTLGSKGSVSPAAATGMINRDDAIIVDVRPIADYSKGHIINSLSIPSNGFASQIETLRKHQEKPVIVACRSGAQSSHACKQLRKAGFEKVFNLQGGILAWQSADLPISKK